MKTSQNNPLPPTPDLQARLKADLDEAEKKAWDSLARYKFQMFGYWAAIWVHLNRVGNFKLKSPFKSAVDLARKTTDEHRSKN